MPSTFEADNNTSEDLDEKNKFFKELPSLGKVLNLERSFSRNSSFTPKSRPKSTKKVSISEPKPKPDEASKEENLPKEKKSIWDWKALKVTLSRNRKFNCSFSLQVHLIEGFPSSLNGCSICVYWKRKDDILVTPPAKVVKGVAEFEHVLTYTCLIYGSKSGPQNSAKYEAKHSLLYASVVGSSERDLGVHRIDLTRFLPLTLEELSEEKSSEPWTTSFRLSGTAKGAVMNVSFGYVMIGDKTGATANTPASPAALSLRRNSSAAAKLDKYPSALIRTGSLPSFISDSPSENVDEVKDLHEVLPLPRSTSSGDIYKIFIGANTYNALQDMPEFDVCKENHEPFDSDVYSSPDIVKDKPENLEKVKLHEDDEVNVFSVVDKGIEFSLNENVVVSTCTVDIDSTQESFKHNVKIDTQDKVNHSSTEKVVIHEVSYIEDDCCTKEILLQEIESALKCVSELEALASESPNIMEAKSEQKMRKSQSLDDFMDPVAVEFLSMLGKEHSSKGLSLKSEAESPRELLLRQFEMETKSQGFSLFDFDMGSDCETDDGCETSPKSEPPNFSKGVESSSLFKNLHEGHPIWLQDMSSKQRAQLVEDLEAETLMKEWGLNEKAFQHSPPTGPSGFGSPIDVLPKESIMLPPLAEGLGPFVQTKDGGFLRSMDPSLFGDAKNGGKLIMQISIPLVVPAEMGSGVMEVLKCLASSGIEKLSMQANKLMPLQDVSGKTMKQIAWEAMPVQGKARQCHLKDNLVKCQDTACVLKALKGTSSLKFTPSSVCDQTGSEFVSLEALAPLAMDKIEALSMEGLRIQSGLSEEDAPSNIIAQPSGDISSALQGNEININGSFPIDGAAALKLLDIKDKSSVVDGIMALSLTLDEWMRLDSGEEIDDIDNISEHTSKLLAAHRANSFDLIRGTSKGERKHGQDPGSKRGLLGNNFTVALMVQLRDPLRNYEPVGTPMFSLIQVERLFFPPKQKLYKCLCEVGNTSDHNDNDDDDDSECEIVAKVEKKENKKEEKISEEDSITQFRITDVHVAGLKTEPQRKKLWYSSSKHRHSGSRWLLANGMGKTKKNPLMKSSKVASKSGSAPLVTTGKSQPGDILWSISSRIYGTGVKWMDLTALNSHTRNPNIIIPNETIAVR